MRIDPKNILLLGVKRTVIAYDKNSGRRLWSTELASSMSDYFLTLIADDTHVFAHTKGELFCLNLFNGQILWHDPLKGFGYGLASLALPGGPQNDTALTARRIQDEAAAQAGTST